MAKKRKRKKRFGRRAANVSPLVESTGEAALNDSGIDQKIFPDYETQKPVKDKKDEKDFGRFPLNNPAVFIFACVFAVVIGALYGIPNIKTAVSLSSLSANERVAKTLYAGLDALENLAETLKFTAVREQLNLAVEKVDKLDPIRLRHSRDVLSYLGYSNARNKVLIIGASSMQFELGAAIERGLNGIDHVSARRLGRKSTGLNWPERLDWIQKTEELSKLYKPDILIIQFGGNDCVRTRNPKGPEEYERFGTPLWDEIYTEKLGALIDVFRKSGGRDVIILGMPVMKDYYFSARIEHLNGVLQKAAALHGAYYFSLWRLSGKALNNRVAYQDYMQIDGKFQKIRMEDGVHFSKEGAFYISGHIMDFIRKKIVF